MNLHAKALLIQMITSYLLINQKYEFYSFGLRERGKSCNVITLLSLFYKNNLLFLELNLKKESQLVAQRLSVLHGINAPEFFDKAVFSSFIANLKEQRYFDESGYTVLDKIEELASTLSHLISTEICLTVKGTIEKSEDLSS